MYRRAVDLIDKEQYSLAIPLLKKATAAAPNEAVIHHYLGYALWKERQLDEAMQELKRAHELDPASAYTEYFMARIAYAQGRKSEAAHLYEAIVAAGEPVFDTYQRLGQIYLGQGDWTNSLELTRQAAGQTPWEPAVHLQLSKVYSKMGRTVDAQRELETSERLRQVSQTSIQKLLRLSDAIQKQQKDEALQLRKELLAEPSHDPEILTWLGTLLGQSGLYAESVEPLEVSVAKAPNSFEAHYNLGLTLLKLGKNSEAETHLLKALELQPRSFEANSTLAVLDVEQNRNRQAIERLRAANEARPRNPKVLALLGEQYLRGHYVDEAIQCLGEAVRLRPDNSKTRYLLIEAYQNGDEFDQALAEAREAAKLFPSEARAHFEVGHQLANLGRYQEARPSFEKAAEIDSSFTEAFGWLGELEFQTGAYEAGLRYFEKARGIEPQHLIALRGIAKCLIRLKRYQEALTEIEKSIETHPNDAELHFDLSQLYTRLGEREKATQVMATYQRLRAEEIHKQDLERKRRYEVRTN